MRLPSVDIDNIDIKLEFGDLLLNVLFIKFGYFQGSVRQHSHSRHSYELHYIPYGQGILIAEGKRYSLTPGSLFMTGPDITHGQIPDPANPMAEYCIFFEAIPGDTQPGGKYSDRRNKLLSELLQSTPFWIGPDKENMLVLFEMLVEELTLRRIGFYQAAKNVLETIIIRAVRHYEEYKPCLEEAPLKTLNDSRLLTIENCFLYEYQTITLGTLADRIALSTRQTERTIQKHYGLSFKDKKLQSRMEVASQLLLSTGLSISSIAAQTGFSTIEHFSQAFKQYFGITATQYRNQKA